MIDRTPPLPTRKDIVARAKNRLEEHDLFRGRSGLLRFDEHDGQLVIHGHLPSYYLKQILQTTLRDIDGVKEIDNRVDVLWPHDE